MFLLIYYHTIKSNAIILRLFKFLEEYSYNYQNAYIYKNIEYTE